MIPLFVELVVYVIFVSCTCATALVLGGSSERRVAIGFLLAAAASVAGSVVGTSHWRGPNWNVIVVDVMFLGWLTMVACQSDRFWPLWAAAAQLDGTIAHFPAIVIPNLPMKIYATTQPLWAFPILISLLMGSIMQRGSSRICK